MSQLKSNKKNFKKEIGVLNQLSNDDLVEKFETMPKHKLRARLTRMLAGSRGMEVARQHARIVHEKRQATEDDYPHHDSFEQQVEVEANESVRIAQAALKARNNGAETSDQFEAKKERQKIGVVDKTHMLCKEFEKLVVEGRSPQELLRWVWKVDCKHDFDYSVRAEYPLFEEMISLSEKFAQEARWKDDDWRIVGPYPSTAQVMAEWEPSVKITRRVKEIMEEINAKAAI